PGRFAAIDYLVNSANGAFAVFLVQAAGPRFDVAFEFVLRIAKQILKTFAPPNLVVDEVPVPDGVIGSARYELKALGSFAGSVNRGLKLTKRPPQKNVQQKGSRPDKNQPFGRLNPRNMLDPSHEPVESRIREHDPQPGKNEIKKNKQDFGPDGRNADRLLRQIGVGRNCLHQAPSRFDGGQRS